MSVASPAESDSGAANSHLDRGPLGDIRVLDLGRVVSGPFATQILGDLGAEIIRIEAVPSRASARPAADAPFTETEAFSWGINRNKRSVSLDLKSQRGREIVLALAEQADVVFDNFRPGVLERLGLSHAELSARNPAIVTCSLTGFGETGPWSRIPAYDPIVQAMSGTMSFTGTGLPGGAPVRWAIPIGDLLAGVYSCIGIVAALLRRDGNGTGTGTGEHVDVSMLDVALAMNTYRVPLALTFGQTLRPSPFEGGQGTVPYGTFECGDGRWLALGVTEKMWRAACRVLDRTDLVTDERFADMTTRYTNRDELTAIVGDELKKRPMQQWQTEFLEAGVVAGGVAGVAEVFTHPQVQARQMAATLTDELGRHATVAGDPMKLASDPVWRAPRITGADTRVVLADVLGYTAEDCDELLRDGIVYWPEDASAEPLRPRVPAKLGGSAEGAHNGFTVLELDGDEPSKCFAGQILADLGLRVIRVERPVGLVDEPYPDDARAGSSRSGLNRGKQSIVLDLKSAEGRAAMNSLIAGSDVILDNYRPGVLDRLGLSWADASQLNPAIISCSITGYGHHGPWSRYPAFDGAIQALGGGMSLTVDPATPEIPVRWGVPMGGQTGSLYAALATVAALRGRVRQSHGRRIDISLLDAQVSLLSYRVPQALDAGVVFRPQPRIGGSGALPFGTYRTADDRWFVIAIADQFWSTFCDVVGRPEWRDDARFVTEVDRRSHEPELTDLVHAVMLEQDAEQWQRKFFQAQIPGAVVVDLPAAFAHEQVRAREMLIDLPDPLYGTVQVAGSPIKFSSLPAPSYRAAPLAGADRAEISAEFKLDLADDAFRSLETTRRHVR